MSKTKRLKNYIKSYNYIFERIIKNYKLNNTASFLYDYLDYKGENGSIRIALVNNSTIKVLKQDKERRIVEIITIGEDGVITATERIRSEKQKEDVTRTYKDDELVSLSSTITFNSYSPAETIRISLTKDKVLINDRDVSLLYSTDNKGIEERYNILRTYYSKPKEAVSSSLTQSSEPKRKKSKRQLVLEEQLRTYIKEEFNYKAPLDKRNLEDLLRIINMLTKRKTIESGSIQYKKTF